MGKTVAVIGTGYVGLVTAVCFADVGHRVTCVDNDAAKVEMLNRGEMPIYEVGLEALCHKNHKEGRITFTGDIAAAIHESEYIFIAVGTPQLPNGDVNMSAVDAVSRSIAEHINGYKVIVDKSTVPVGTQEKITATIRSTRPESDFDVVSNPEFLREGSAVHDVQNTDRIIIGAETKRAADKMMELYEYSDAPKLVMSAKSAELTKYAANSFLASKITFINEIANLCDLVGADVTQVSKGMMTDRRIAPYFLLAGIGFGGGCFPKDTRALSFLAKTHGYEFRMLDAVIDVNDNQKYVVVDKAVHALEGEVSGKKVAIWGLSFKPGTNDVRGSIGIEIVLELKKRGAVIAAHDPRAMEDAKRLLKEEELCKDMYEAAEGAEILLLLTEWQDYVEADFDKVKTLLARPVVVDGRNCLDKAALDGKGFTYTGVGH